MNGRWKLGAVVVASIVALGMAQVALAQVEWTFQGVAIPPGPPGSWDSYRHTMGDVVFDGITYHQFRAGGQTYLPWDSPFHVGHWTSTSLTGPWVADFNPVLSPEPGQWDGFTIYDLAVRYDGGVFRMWYGATATPLGPCNVGYATSLDGSLWIKYAGNPLPTLAPGAAGEWDDRGVMPGTVLFDDVEYRMWTTAIKDGGPDYGTWRLGTATSPDGITWTKHPDPVLVGSLPWEDNLLYLPEVISSGGGYAMWYDGVVWGQESHIGYAVSPDGIHWGRWPGNPVLSAPGGNTVIEGLQVIVEGDTVHAWVDTDNNGVWYVTSPLEVVFFDYFETGTTGVWSFVMP